MRLIDRRRLCGPLARSYGALTNTVISTNVTIEDDTNQETPIESEVKAISSNTTNVGKVVANEVCIVL